VLNVNQSIRFERVDARGTDEGAKLERALRLADFLIDCDMALGVNLVGIETEFGLDVDRHFSYALAAALY
jgi:hypothetical protein